MKSYDEWTKEELWDQVKMNFSAHMLLMYSFLRTKEIELDEFTRYVAQQVLPGWKSEVRTVDDLMNGILLNVLANGGSVRSIARTDNEITAVVSQLLEGDILDSLDLEYDDTHQLWNKFMPIASALDMNFTWTE
jgi:hypothetical protein